MEPGSAIAPPTYPRLSVLVVDSSPETREVLRMALTGRGAQVLEASHAAQGRRLAREHHPDVLVLDLELDAASETLAGDFDSEADDAPATILLGSARRVKHGFPRGQFVSKPYHYAPLIRKIEQLLDSVQQPRQARQSTGA